VYTHLTAILHVGKGSVYLVSYARGVSDATDQPSWSKEWLLYKAVLNYFKDIAILVKERKSDTVGHVIYHVSQALKDLYSLLYFVKVGIRTQHGAPELLPGPPSFLGLPIRQLCLGLRRAILESEHRRS
jgi:hypothetical protein